MVFLLYLKSHTEAGDFEQYFEAETLQEALDYGEKLIPFLDRQIILENLWIEDLGISARDYQRAEQQLYASNL